MTALSPARTAGPDLRIRIASALACLCGLWLIASPWVLGTGYRHGALVNDPVVGIIVALLAAIRFLGAPAMTWPSWMSIPFGVWTLISPWVYGFASESSALKYDSIVLGLAIAVLSFWAAVAGLEAEDRTRDTFL